MNVWHFRQNVIERWMQFNLRNEHIVISLSTTPYRINELEPFLDKLLQQKGNVAAIYLNVPYVFKRKNIPYTIPTWLEQKKGITILRCEDYGPGTKLLGTLANVDLPSDTIIITVDDDVFYPDNLILQLAYKAKLTPNRAIGIIGANPDYDTYGNIPFDSELGLIKIKTADALVSILQGYAGIAYRKNFFDDAVFDITSTPADCINSDDIYLSFYLARNGIQRQVLRNNYINGCKIYWETETGTNNTALHNLIPKPADKHRSCINYLKQQTPEVEF